MPRIKDIARQLRGAPVPASIKKRLHRNGFHYGLRDDLPPFVVERILDWYSPKNSTSPGVNDIDTLRKTDSLPDKAHQKNGTPRSKTAKKTVQKPDKEERDIPFLVRVLPYLSLPMMGLALSWGVYHFATNFVPFWVAVGIGGAFEFIFIGLTALKAKNGHHRQLARRVAKSAVAVSLTYNTFSAAMFIDPNIFVGVEGAVLWTLAVVHAAPTAILMYFTAVLLLEH